MNSVVHFEMPHDNPERVAKFYHKAFGWETQALGEKMGNYVLVSLRMRARRFRSRQHAIPAWNLPAACDASASSS
jgi:hypothetical protein